MTNASAKEKVLIVCTGNACRSQMAEALWRHEAGGRYEVASAGTSPAGVHPLARQVIEELGIDMSGHYSKSVFQLDLDQFDLVVTVCGSARDTCLAVRDHRRHLHWPIEDPIVAAGTLDERLAEFRRIRDEIHERIRAFLSSDAQ
jgi:arsenate reductase